MRKPGRGPLGGTFAGQATKGAVCVGTVNAVLYENAGAQAAPTWTKVGTEPLPASAIAREDGMGRQGRWSAFD